MFNKFKLILLQYFFLQKVAWYGATTFSIMTPSMTVKFWDLYCILPGVSYAECHHAEHRYAACHYGECHHAEHHLAEHECRIAESHCASKPNVIILSVIMLSVITVCVVMLTVVAPGLIALFNIFKKSFFFSSSFQKKHLKKVFFLQLG